MPAHVFADSGVERFGQHIVHVLAMRQGSVMGPSNGSDFSIEFGYCRKSLTQLIFRRTGMAGTPRGEVVNSDEVA
jgi:hypothetical protein